MRRFGLISTFSVVLALALVIVASSIPTASRLDWIYFTALPLSVLGAILALLGARGRKHALPELKLDAWLQHERVPRLKFAGLLVLPVVPVVLILVALSYMQSGRIVATDAGQWQRMTLTDGTSVHLDARSKVGVEYTNESRVVRVYEGSAVFEVMKDPKRPFIARTHLVDVTAIGTRFGISIDSGVTATVSEGTVTVRGRGKAVTLKAGGELRVTDSALSSPQFSQVDAERKLQWANGVLILEKMTVSEGVREFNRRNRVQIIVDSPTLGEKVVDFAAVQVDSPEGYARVLAQSSGASIFIDKEKGVIRLMD